MAWREHRRAGLDRARRVHWPELNRLRRAAEHRRHAALHGVANRLLPGATCTHRSPVRCTRQFSWAATPILCAGIVDVTSSETAQPAPPVLETLQQRVFLSLDGMQSMMLSGVADFLSDQDAAPPAATATDGTYAPTNLEQVDPAWHCTRHMFICTAAVARTSAAACHPERREAQHCAPPHSQVRRRLHRQRRQARVGEGRPIMHPRSQRTVLHGGGQQHQAVRGVRRGRHISY